MATPVEVTIMKIKELSQVSPNKTILKMIPLKRQLMMSPFFLRIF